MRFRRWFACSALCVIAVACAPRLDVDAGSRQSQLDRVVVDGVLGPDGTLTVTERVEFASDNGGLLALPGSPSGPAVPPTLPNGSPLPAAPANAQLVDVRVDGRPVEAESADRAAEIDVSVRRATVTYRVLGAVERYTDVAVLDVDALPSPSDSSRWDPDVALDVVVTLPTGAQAESVRGWNFAGRERSVGIAGDAVTFRSDAPTWRDNAVAVAFPPELVPGVAAFAIAYRATLEGTLADRAEAEETTEASLRRLDAELSGAEWIVVGIAIGLPTAAWLAVLAHVARVWRDRRRGAGPVPERLVDPPTADDPAVVGTLWGWGRPDRRAVAGTLLALAERRAVRIDEIEDGASVRVVVPIATTGRNESERIVLAALRERADADCSITGPPLWRGRTRWWRRFRRDATRRARGAGLVTPVLPFPRLGTAFGLTAVGVAVFLVANPWAYLPILLGGAVLAQAVSLVSGVTLTGTGLRHRALWEAFGRYVHEQGHLGDVGAAAVAVWGPYLVYGVVLGEADRAASALSP